MIGILSIHLHLSGCASLKEKRGRLKPLLARLHRQFNVSAVELDLQDKWTESVIACAMLSNSQSHVRSALETVRKWVEANWPDGEVIDTNVETIP